MSTNNPKSNSKSAKKPATEYVMFAGIKVPKNPPKDPKERAKWEKKIEEAEKKARFEK